MNAYVDFWFSPLVQSNPDTAAGLRGNSLTRSIVEILPMPSESKYLDVEMMSKCWPTKVHFTGGDSP